MFNISKYNQNTVLFIYVDDVILVDTSLSEFDRIKGILHSNFKIMDLEILKYIFCFEVAHSREGIVISQRKYFLYLLHDT